MHPLDSFTLGPLPLLTSPSEQAYQDASIELAFSSNLTLCAALIEQSQDRAARTALKGVQYVVIYCDAALSEKRIGAGVKSVLGGGKAFGQKQIGRMGNARSEFRQMEEYS
jgi:hypothetical protein